MQGFILFCTMYNWILNYAIDLVVILSMEMIVIHKRDEDWSAKLPTESNGTLSMNIVSKGKFKISSYLTCSSSSSHFSTTIPASYNLENSFRTSFRSTTCREKHSTDRNTDKVSILV